MTQVVHLFEDWQKLEHTDWVVPLQIVKSESGSPTGYIMQRVIGSQLREHEGRSDVPLPEIVAKVTLAISHSFGNNIFPCNY